MTSRLLITKSVDSQATLPLPSKVSSLLLPLYEGCHDDKCPCEMTYAPKRGLVPRGMAGATKDVNEVRVIVVGKNPASPTKEERHKYGKIAEKQPGSQRQRAGAMLDAASQCVEELYLHPKGGKRLLYQARLMRFLKEALELTTDQEVLEQVYFTELLKCTDEENVSPDLFDRAHLGKTEKCVKRWLSKELELFPRAEAVVALGHEAEIALMAWTRRPIVYLRHPRAYNEKQYHASLDELKHILQP